MNECDYCGEKTFMPYNCRYCGGVFCPKHRLPENHDCKGLDDISKKSREEGKIYKDVDRNLRRGESEEIPNNRYREIPEREDWIERQREKQRVPEPSFGILGLIKNLFLSKATTMLLFAMVIIFIGQQVIQIILGGNYYRFEDYSTFMYYLAPSLNTVMTRPWTIFTSMFIHGDFSHIFLNAIVLFFVGSALERIIGKNKFIYLFIVSGAIAAVAQIFFTDPSVVVLGASGAILGVLGALTVLAPRMPVFLFFIIPMPLWVLTLGYGILSILMAITGFAGSIGHVAHLSGLAVGLIYGYKIREDKKKQFRDFVRKSFESRF